MLKKLNKILITMILTLIFYAISEENPKSNYDELLIEKKFSEYVGVGVDLLKESSFQDSNNVVNILSNSAFLIVDTLRIVDTDTLKLAADMFYKAGILKSEGLEKLKLLNNAVYFYKISGEFISEIEVIDEIFNNISDDSEIFNLEKGRALYNLNRSSESISFFEKVAQKEPKDSLNVEAYYWLGIINSENNRDEALKYFSKAEDLSTRLMMSGKGFNRYYYLEVLFEKANFLYDQFINISFDDPFKIAEMEIEKKSVYSKLIKLYDRILEYGNFRSGEILIKKISLLENYGNVKFYQNNAKDHFLESIIKKKTSFQLASEFYQKAVSEYFKAIGTLEKFMEEYKKSSEEIRSLNQQKLIQFKEENLSYDEYFSSLNQNRFLQEDDTEEYILSSIDSIKTSIIRMNYMIGNSYKEMAYNYSKIAFDGKRNDYENYIEGDVFIDKAIIPYLDQMEYYYSRVNSLSDSLSSGVIYKTLAEKDKNDLVEIYTEIYKNIIYKLYDSVRYFLSNSDKYLVSKKRNYFVSSGSKMLQNDAIFDEMSDLLSFGDSLILNSTAKIKNLILKSNVNQSHQSIPRFYKELIENNDSLYLDIENRIIGLFRIQNTTDPSRPGRAFEYYFELLDLINNNEFQILYNSLFVSNYFPSDSTLSHLKSVLIDKYYVRALKNYDESKLKSYKIQSDVSWKVTTKIERGYYLNSLIVDNWEYPVPVSEPKIFIDGAINIRSLNNKFDNLYDPKSNVYTDLKTPLNSYIYRKDFEITDYPIKAEITLAADEKFMLILNEKLITTSDDLNIQSQWYIPKKIDITEYLKPGFNSIVIVTNDRDRSEKGMAALLNFNTIDKNYAKSLIDKIE
ncbi:MAG: tetratricopeptide repeat protein [Candidatus Delongbacteria bacterium]|nr:tetratricopeptide repeat protein [Candidatus Delongbacteria bacterium]MBN2835017.1 tetratricopeptide repeat protein [Candidatus Delongbacteria bacterium]